MSNVGPREAFGHEVPQNASPRDKWTNLLGSIYIKKGSNYYGNLQSHSWTKEVS